MEGETQCSGSRLSDNVTTACICVVTIKVSLPKKKKKKKKKNFFFFFFFRETPTSPWVPFRAKFRPLGRLFRPSRPLAWSLVILLSLIASDYQLYLSITSQLTLKISVDDLSHKVSTSCLIKCRQVVHVLSMSCLKKCVDELFCRRFRDILAPDKLGP